MIRKLLGSLREYKKQTICSALGTAVEVITDILIPLLMVKLIDAGIIGGDTAEITKYGCLMLLCIVIGFAGGAFSAVSSSAASVGFAKNLREDIFSRVQTFSFANIDKFSTAGLVTRITTDVSNVENAFGMIVQVCVRTPLSVIFALIMSFTICPRIALVFLVMIPVLTFLLCYLVLKADPVFKKVFRTYDLLNSVTQENLNAVRVVKSFVREDFEEKKFKDVSGALYDVFVRGENIMSYTNPIMKTCVYTTMLFIMGIGSRVIVLSGGTDLTTGQLSSLITYAMMILSCLMMLSVALKLYTIAKSSGMRIAEVLDEESSLHNPENPVYEVADGSISFRNVDFSYFGDKNRLALKDISLEIPSGATVGIIGSTGNGKTSLVSLISRLYDVTDGSVCVGGRDVREYDLASLRDQVAVVLQKNTLFSGTIAENLRWGNPDATDEEIIRASKLAQADEFVSEMPDKYNTYIEQGGTNVSGGQKQRLCIARALLKKPKILILDDSTSAVDTRTDALIRKAFAEEIPNTTKIIIAQRISSVQDADFIIVMNEDHIDGIGTHDELVKNNTIYREVYETQQKGEKE